MQGPGRGGCSLCPRPPCWSAVFPAVALLSCPPMGSVELLCPCTWPGGCTGDKSHRGRSSHSEWLVGRAGWSLLLLVVLVYLPWATCPWWVAARSVSWSRQTELSPLLGLADVLEAQGKRARSCAGRGWADPGDDHEGHGAAQSLARVQEGPSGPFPAELW